MNSFSHVIIGRYLHRYLRDHHGIELSWGNFIYGNMLPDFRPAYKKQPHEKEYWARYMQSEFGKLSAVRQDSASFGVNYSRRLGIICHFYTDFFCHAHTARFEGGTYPHIQYEWALHRHVQESIPALQRKDFGGSMSKGRDAAAIQGSFMALQEEYLREKPSFDTDIIYTLRACIDVITSVTGNSVIEKKAGIFVLLPDTAKV